MTYPPWDVILRLPSGGEHAICHEETIDEHLREQRSYSTYAGTPALLELVQLVQRAIPGAEVTSPAQASAETAAVARRRGLAYDREWRTWDYATDVALRERDRERARTRSAAPARPDPARSPEPRRATGGRASR